MFWKLKIRDDKATMTFNISTYLQSLFTWNIKQVFAYLAAGYQTSKNSLNKMSLWDVIIPAKELAKFSIRTSNEYRFIDQGKEYNLTLHWHIMPKKGKMHADKLVMTGSRMLAEYR